MPLKHSATPKTLRWQISKLILMNSLDVLSSARGPSDSLCEERKENDHLFLQNRLDILQRGLENITGEVLAEITSAVEDNIFDKFGLASSQACNKANKAHAKGFTNTMIQPMMPVLAVGWERSFSLLIPKMLTRYSKSSYVYVKALQVSLEPRISAGTLALNMTEKLKAQLPTYQASFKELSAASKKFLCESPKAANRAFVPIIAAELEEAYEGCGSAIGRGDYLRMKDIMTQHVEKRRHEMFHKSTEHVKSRTRRQYPKISWDYKNAFEKSQTAEEKALNEELRKLLQINTMFDVPAASNS
ncbi:hypothetical protein ACJ73_04006 [Blastomyces percursus]|uniref:Uncharacterized protein n=1 Tax=Blastomyces percursus TaxID=1658174 RepID=A0A1J9Q796_9EURO|nr:hypothetical protein ACJ73_04006 [Blastomyces percursus]